MSLAVVPFTLQGAPSLIERLLPVQKLSAESFKEQMAGSGKTLVSLGSYWKGRKPLILNRACLLACLLPATNDPAQDLRIFEMLMAMDDESFVLRWKRRPRPREVLEHLELSDIAKYFDVSPQGALGERSPVDFGAKESEGVRIEWRTDLPEMRRRRLEAQLLPRVSYRERVELARRPEEVGDLIHAHIWEEVNAHLGTNASSIQSLVFELGVMRWGHRPRVADAFSGSGQIPFEAARLGCDVYASDLNPIACMLTWGALNIVGAAPEVRQEQLKEQEAMVLDIQQLVNELDVESDGRGWRAKAYLYCVEALCPQTGWRARCFRVELSVVHDPGWVGTSLLISSQTRSTCDTRSMSAPASMLQPLRRPRSERFVATASMTKHIYSIASMESTTRPSSQRCAGISHAPTERS
jgi:putative DNA methylase